MTGIQAAWSAMLDRQHRLPSGILGHIIGERMRIQHAPETDWSIELLALRPADRVLEIGPGAGRGIALALQRAGQVVGLDLSHSMLRAAGRRNRSAIRGGRLALLRGDVAGLPFGQPCFDKIMSIHTFYFWPDHAAICARLIGLLAPGGRMVCTLSTMHTQSDGRRSIWPVQQQLDALLLGLQRQAGIAAQLAEGPSARGFNSVALVIDRV